MAEVLVLFHKLAVYLTVKNFRYPRRPKTRSICFSLSGGVTEEGLDNSAPDSSEEDILSMECV
jgi:hypothetical protein